MNVESLLHGIEHRFGLEGKGKALLEALIALIGGHEMGGLPGFVERFRKAGLGKAVDSWLSGNAPIDLRPEQLKAAIGAASIEKVAHDAGLPVSKAAPGLAALIPELLGKIAHGGHLPHALPPGLTGPPASEVPGVSSDRVSWIWIVLPVVLLGLLGSRQCGSPTTSHAPAAHGTKIEGPAFDTSAAIKAANEQVLIGLKSLKPGFQAEELIKILDLMIVNFASGSAEIPEDSKDLLDRSAEALKQAPAGTAVEVSGHTDSAGDEASNLKLSEARAAAVRAYLVSKGVPESTLTAKGYGPAKPAASNDTEEGRFRNRRIDYALVK